MGRERADPDGERREETRRLILNPTSGRGDHAERVRRLARERGFALAETERAGHAVDLAERAVDDGVDLLAVAGGDGTLHEVVQGVAAAGGLESVTLAVVPVGTENIVAGDLGVPDVEAGFEVADRGETRRLDLGTADGEPFVMSVVAGLPAEASAAATHELKNKFGSFAFVVGGVREALAFDGVQLEVDAAGGEAATWRGEALCVLVGNLRQVSERGRANAEDGLLEVVIVEQLPPTDAVAEAVERRLLDRETAHVTEFETPRVDVVGLDEEPVTLSLDGEIRTRERTRLGVSPGALRVRVGDAYEPDPGGA